MPGAGPQGQPSLCSQVQGKCSHTAPDTNVFQNLSHQKTPGQALHLPAPKACLILFPKGPPQLCSLTILPSSPVLCSHTEFHFTYTGVQAVAWKRGSAAVGASDPETTCSRSISELFSDSPLVSPQEATAPLSPLHVPQRRNLDDPKFPERRA